MCTVTVVPHAEGVRLVCNRDELRTRPAARPPERTHVDGLEAVWPVDPAGGGTWIGVNAAGLAMALLNRAPLPRTARPADVRSRGTIIPALLGLSRIDHVLAEARHLTGPFEPFTLVLLQGRRVVTLTGSDGAVREHDVTAPLMFTSSSLGDDLVEGPRRRLFDRLVGSNPVPLSGQTRFHRHLWRARPEISVCMSRADAMTVSRTAIDISTQTIRMDYFRRDGETFTRVGGLQLKAAG